MPPAGPRPERDAITRSGASRLGTTRRPRATAWSRVYPVANSGGVIEALARACRSSGRLHPGSLEALTLFALRAGTRGRRWRGRVAEGA